MGILIAEETFLFALHFTDDQVVIAQDKEDAEYLCRKLKEEYQNWGLTLNMDKTKYLCVGDPTEDLQLDEGIKVQACEQYVYLGVKIDKSGRCKREISSRIAKGRRTVGALNSILWGHIITVNVKKRIYNANIKSILQYGCEVWQLRKRDELRIMATEMDYWRRAAGISRLERILIERVREIMGVDGNIVQNIQK
jgi:hypothetical protein